MESYRQKFIQTGKFAPMKHFMVGVFVLAFGLETYHHHKFHGGEDAASGGEDANGKEKESAAASAREAMGAVSSLDDVQREVDALGARVRAMRETMMGR